jgi:hypothetical protein
MARLAALAAIPTPFDGPVAVAVAVGPPGASSAVAVAVPVPAAAAAAAAGVLTAPPDMPRRMSET